LMARDVFWDSVVVRLLIFSPLGVLLLTSAHRHRQAILATGNPHITNWIIALSGYGAAICLAVILLISKSPLIMYYHAGMMVVMLYGTLVQHLHYKAGILFLAAILALQVMCGAFGQSMPGPIKVAMTEMLLVAAIFCMVASITVEKARRKRYLLLLRERSLSESLLAVNMKLQQLSRSDVLTGVANRRHLHEHLQQVWDRAVADRTPVSALMLDVDHFKAYNDRYGHPAGDECLKQVAHSVTSSLRRPDDFVARYGGEEFVALLPGASEEIALQAAERVRQGVEALNMRHEGSTTAKVVTISVGVATLHPGQSSLGPDQLISMADQALYEAKRGTRNCVSVKVP
jgi:diguanylate cyclase (GGDEF)-like protein